MLQLNIQLTTAEEDETKMNHIFSFKKNNKKFKATNQS